MHFASFPELFKEIDFYYPVQANVWPNVCSASWIPDFQHIYLPEFFSPDEIYQIIKGDAPLTSIRRAISNLANPRKWDMLFKTDKMKMGLYGKMVHTWKLKDVE